MRRTAVFVFLLLVLGIAPVIAQDGTCPDIVRTVLENLDQICEATSRNEACYGNTSLEVAPRDGVTDFSFSNVGDIEQLGEINTIRLSPMITEENAWGVALLRLQANIPDTLPGQNVTFLLFGDVEITNAVPEGGSTAPMQAFYLKTGVSRPECAEAPQDGLIVQTPEGRGQVTFNVNGVTMALGSTALLQAPNGEQTIASMIEGNGALKDPEGQVTPLIAGSEVSFPLDENFMPAGPLSPPVGYGTTGFEALPLPVLERTIEVAEPLTEEQIELIIELVEEGEAPCGVEEFLPDCDDLPVILGGELCELDENGEENCELDSTVFEEIVPFTEAFVEPSAPEEEPVVEEQLPGCEPGICLKDPAEACQCALCGVACPEGTPANQSQVDCAAEPNNPACQQAGPTPVPQQPPGGLIGGPPSGGVGGTGDNPPPSGDNPPPVVTSEPAPPTEEPTPDGGGCLPFLPNCNPPGT